MVVTAKTICPEPGCNRLTNGGRCQEHMTECRRLVDKGRGTTTQRGYGYRWARISEMYRNRNPLCEHCLRENITKPAECVDHIIPHKGDAILLYDWNNLQSLCWSCHSRKTRAESCVSK